MAEAMPVHNKVGEITFDNMYGLLYFMLILMLMSVCMGGRSHL